MFNIFYKSDDRNTRLTLFKEKKAWHSVRCRQNLVVPFGSMPLHRGLWFVWKEGEIKCSAIRLISKGVPEGASLVPAGILSCL